MTGLVIAVINQSTCMDDNAVETIAAAVQAQVTDHLEPAWELPPGATLAFVPKGSEPPPRVAQCVVLDDSDQANALGYHEITKEFQPLAKCFVRSCMNLGVLPSVDISHEVLEMLVNPHLENTALRTMGSQASRWYFREACDAVQDDRDGYTYGTIGLQVSNFVLPGFYEVGSVGPWDHLGQLKAAYEIKIGGYLAYYDIGLKAWVQDFGGGATPARQSPEFNARSRFARMQLSHLRPSER